MLIQSLVEYGLFLAKSITIVAALLLFIGGIVALTMRHKKAHGEYLEATHLNKKYEQMEKTLKASLYSQAEIRQMHKHDKKQKKTEDKANKKKAKVKHAHNDSEFNEQKKRLFVLSFVGDIRASAVDALREEVSAVLTHATKSDEVLLCLESSGGMVHSYGLAASQLQRIRDQNIPLTISVDKVAASGGYMMACVANQIIAAPFAIIGSIGVLAQIPNLHRLLKKHDIDFEQLSAGEYKRTLTLFGKNTDKARCKLQQELEETHKIFKQFVKQQRPNLDIDQIATGEHWLGSRAKELGLVDQLCTSDDYLMAGRTNTDLITLKYCHKKNLTQKLSSMMSMSWNRSKIAPQDLDKPLLM